MITLKNIHFVALYCMVSMFLGACIDHTREEIEVLTGIEAPVGILGSDQKLFIMAGEHGTTVYEYSINNSELVCSYGEEGKDQGQFIANEGEGVYVSSFKDRTYVTSFWKVSVFKQCGELLNEIEGIPNTNFYERCEDGFVGVGYKEKREVGYYSINLYNENLELTRELYEVENSYNPVIGNRVLTKEYEFCTGSDKIFARGQSDDYEIAVFNKSGDYISTISRDFSRMNVTENNKNAVLDLYRNHPNFRDYYEEIIKDIIFPEKLPAIKHIAASNKYLYVVTNTVIDGRTEIHILNHEGTLVGNTSIPLVWHNTNTIAPFTIQNHSIYQLVQEKSESSPSLTIHIHRL